MSQPSPKTYAIAKATLVPVARLTGVLVAQLTMVPAAHVTRGQAVRDTLVPAAQPTRGQAVRDTLVPAAQPTRGPVVHFTEGQEGQLTMARVGPLTMDLAVPVTPAPEVRVIQVQGVLGFLVQACADSDRDRTNERLHGRQRVRGKPSRLTNPTALFQYQHLLLIIN